MDKLKIEYVNKEDLKPYVNNAKIHTAEQVEQIKKSIEEFGFNDPIALWHDNEIIEGHGRLLAVMEMDDIKKVPIIRLDDLSDEQRKAYTLVHNKLTMNTDFDTDLLGLELEDITEIDMEQFGFDFEVETEEEQKDDKYTEKTDIPHYEPSDKEWATNELYDDSKTVNLIEEINSVDMPEDIKDFLTIAAYRHVKFNYKRIADYYSRADKDVQELFERSALVIIDFNDAIKNGYTTLNTMAGEFAND